jgi:hypothetical protein
LQDSYLTKISVPTYKQRLEQKNAKVDDHQTCGIVYIFIRLVLHSHLGDPKLADPANVWNLPINIFLALEM